MARCGVKHSRKSNGGAVSNTVGRVATVTVVYYCITGERRELKGDERWVRRVDKKPLKYERKEA